PPAAPRHRCHSCCLRGECRDRLSFVFAPCGCRTDLHSFPTRRSSDLPAGEIGGIPLVVEQLGDADSVLPAPQPDTVFVDARPVRSEEHTSELQSRENLVCRLLLEKKKRPQMRRPRPHPALLRCMLPEP